MPYVKVWRQWEGSPPFVESKTFFYMTDEHEAFAEADAEPRGGDGWVQDRIDPTMDISPTTLTILKTMNRLRGSRALCLRAGRVQSLLNPAQSVLAVATLPDEWCRDSVLPDCARLLKVLSASRQPVIEFRDDAIYIQSPQRTVTFGYGDVVGTARLPLPHPSYDNPAVACQISADDQRRLMKAMHTCRCLHLIVDVQRQRHGDHHVELRADSASGDESVSILVPILAMHDPTFARQFRFIVADIESLPEGGYTIMLGNWMYGVWLHESLPMVFFVAQSSSLG